MAGSMASLAFDGNLRSDVNHSFGTSYVPTVIAKQKFRPDTAETPYQVSDNTVSRKSHYYHEGKMSEYDQVRELYQRVMDDDARVSTSPPAFLFLHPRTLAYPVPALA